MKKIIFFVGSLFFLNSCLQSTAMVGPSLTLAGGGNIYQSSFSYGASKIFEEETGMSTTEYVTFVFEEENKILKEENKLKKIREKKFQEDLYTLVMSNLEKTKKQNELISIVKFNLEKTRKKLTNNPNKNQ
tara:strand:+ start:8843 stop:9235 length:393 start_codon:yes stop_codon:yes gene_type:complete